MSVSANIKRIRELKSLSVDELAKKIGVTRQSVYDWEDGDVIPRKTKLDKIASVLGVKVSDLFKDGSERTEVAVERVNKTLPLYDIIAVGGRDAVADLSPTAHPSERINPGDWFSDATGAIRIYGESMFPKYPNGSVVTFKEVKDRELLLWGSVYVIETSEYRVIKRLQRGEAKGYVRADSDNTVKSGSGKEVHESFEIPLNKIKRLFLVLGKVERLQA